MLQGPLLSSPRADLGQDKVYKVQARFARLVHAMFWIRRDEDMSGENR